jgi:hypothetical protein
MRIRKNARYSVNIRLTAHTIMMIKINNETNHTHTHIFMYRLETQKTDNDVSIEEYFEFHDVNDKENQHRMHHL